MTTLSKEKKTIKKVSSKASVKKATPRTGRVKKASEQPVTPLTVKQVKKPIKHSGVYLSSVGRRKSAIARVRLYRQGAGKFTVNGLDLSDYFSATHEQEYILKPLLTVGLQGQVDVTVKVVGGGKRGQMEAVRHGLARSLLVLNDDDYRKPLRTAGFLTRDARVKERKKYGLKKARRAPQWQKR